MPKNVKEKIGIIDFNPDQEPDKRNYVKRISKLIPRNIECEGLFFKKDFDLSKYSALILSGSRLSATDYQRMVRDNSIEGEDYVSIERVVKKLSKYQGNMFGICFGAQLMIHMMGGDLGKIPQTEAGYLEHKLSEDGKRDEVFKNLPASFFGSQLHSDYVKILPSGGNVKEAIILATRDNFIHAYKIICKDGSIKYGVQPHPEMSNKNDAVFLVKVNKSWLQDSIGKIAFDQALLIPPNADYSLSKVITKFAESLI